MRYEVHSVPGRVPPAWRVVETGCDPPAPLFAQEFGDLGFAARLCAHANRGHVQEQMRILAWGDAMADDFAAAGCPDTGGPA